MVTPASEFVKDITVALAAAPVTSSVSVTSLVVNRPWVLQLNESTGDLLFGWEKWAEQEITCISGDSVAHRTLVECLLCTRCLAVHWGWRGVQYSRPSEDRVLRNYQKTGFFSSHHSPALGSWSHTHLLWVIQQLSCFGTFTCVITSFWRLLPHSLLG